MSAAQRVPDHELARAYYDGGKLGYQEERSVTIHEAADYAHAEFVKLDLQDFGTPVALDVENMVPTGREMRAHPPLEKEDE
jgi:hypothetical protein